MAEKSLLDMALIYAKRGLYVLPILPGAKNPAIKYKNEPPLAANQIKYYWHQNSNYNIALRTVNHFVIDVDSAEHTGNAQKDGYKSLNSIPKTLLPKTLTEASPSGGMHFYYLKPSGCDLSQKLDWLPGIDIKAHINNYSVVAPSIGKNGQRYHWLDPKQPMVEAPQALIDYIENHGSSAKGQSKKPLLTTDYSKIKDGKPHSSRWTGQLINEIAEPHKKGTRNKTIAMLTGKMLRADTFPDCIWTIIQDVNNRFYDENTGEKAPLSQDELENTFASILRDEVKNHGQN